MTRTTWIVIACLALVSLPFVAAIAAMLGSTASEGDIVSIRGLGNSGNTVYSASARRRAIRAVGLDRDGPVVTDAMLRAMVVAVLERAAKGEPEAVDFALDLAHARRQTAALPVAPAKEGAEK